MLSSHKILTATQELHLESIDLQCDPVLKEKFNCLNLNDLYASLKEIEFPNPGG